MPDDSYETPMIDLVLRLTDTCAHHRLLGALPRVAEF